MAVKREYPKAILFVLLSFLLVGFASAETVVNITISETVNQNVTFAENFNLVENRTYSLIEGVITISNPGTTPVFDINIQLDNVSNLASDFNPVSGRPGFQVIYPNVNFTNQTFSTGNVNSSEYFDLGMDLDEDGTNDSVTLNETHLIFNLTSEFSLRTFAFYNSSNATLNISNTPTVLDMSFNITSLRVDQEYNDGEVFANVTVFGTVTTAGELELGSEVNISINNSARPNAFLHIPELRGGQQTVFHYNVSALTVSPPLDIDSYYTNQEFETKVLAGERFLVQLVASNVATVGALTSVNITLAAEDVNVSNGTAFQVFNFTLHNLSDNTTISGDFANVDNSSNRTWYWTVNNQTIGIGNSYNITFQIQAPNTVSSSGTYLALTQTLSYQINTTASTLAVGDVRGRGSVVFNTTKQIVSPQDNLSNNNVTWRSDPKVGYDANLSFTLEKVSLWVTTTLDPNSPVNGLETDYYPGQEINYTDNWAGSPWYFNFTDGSSDSNPPPIVWIKPYWIIRNTDNQIVNSSITVNGTDLYMNYIYVVNGYWLEVQKQVLDAGDDQYNIFIEVQNRGNGHTPQNLTVTVYDFIDEAFTAFNFSPSANNQSNVTGEFSGIAYQWDVGLRTNLSTSFAPRGDPDGLDFFTVNYTVNGSGDFRVSDLYIVGLDPRLVDGASASEAVSVLTGIASTSTEVLYLAVVVFLLAINIANFLMTSRISKKLEKRK